MKKFDFELARTQPNRNVRFVDWLEKNQDKPISEEEFVEVRTSFKEFRISNGKKYSPSYSRKMYHRLKKNFGFFK